MYLNQSKDQKHNNCTKQERSEEVEVIASLCSPERVQCETHNHHSCYNRSFQNDPPCSHLSFEHQAKKKEPNRTQVLTHTQDLETFKIIDKHMRKQNLMTQPQVLATFY